MSAGIIGADVDQLHQLGDQLRTKPGEIEALISTVTSALANTAWQGPARDRFEGEWHSSFRPALGRLMTAFDAAGNECSTRATALHQAMAL
jgi:uncharacterized protein YukE